MVEATRRLSAGKIYYNMHSMFSNTLACNDHSSALKMSKFDHWLRRDMCHYENLPSHRVQSVSDYLKIKNKGRNTYELSSACAHVQKKYIVVQDRRNS